MRRFVRDSRRCASSGFQPDDACVIGEMTNYAIGLLGNEACRRQFDEEKNAAARTTP